MNLSELKSEINLKNLKPIIFIVVVLVLTAISVYPQRKFGGRVIEVVDGKTCVIQLQSGKLTAVLQYVEIPEPEQPLYQTVKDHLEKMILDQPVEFLPRIVMKDRTVGQLMLKSVDVSQQMLRDGAAWYSIPEKSGQDEPESLLYLDNETQAKNEKRGVWGVEDLKPSWEYRAEQAALKRKQQEEAYRSAGFLGEMQNRNPRPRPGRPALPAPQIEMWADVGGTTDAFDQPLGLGGLQAGYNPTLRIGHVSTPSVFLNFPTAGFLRKVETRLFYIYRGDKTNVEYSVYAVGFLSASKDYKFLKFPGAVITADSQKIVLRKRRRLERKEPSHVWELMLYEITRAQLAQIAKARNITVQLGNYKGTLSAESLMLINNLLAAS